jgi:pimeloyl-ACP methyl ester carboxylesterase
MPRLAAAGHRALALQLPGYPPSGPLPDYGRVNVARALEAAISALTSERVHVVGYDWGAVSAYALAALAALRVRSLTAIGVVHPRFTPRSPDFVWRSRHILGFQVKALARRSLLREDARYLETLYRRWSPAWADPSQDVDNARRMLVDRAAVDSTTQYYRDMARGPTLREDLQLDATPIAVPTLVLAGRSDGCFRLEEYEPQRSHFTGGYAFEVIEGGGHFLHRERPAAVMRELLAFLEANQP